MLEWVAIPFSFPTQGSNPHFLHFRRILYRLRHQGSPGFSKEMGYSLGLCF